MANAILDNEGYNVYVGPLTAIQGCCDRTGTVCKSWLWQCTRNGNTVPKRIIDGISMVNQGSENCNSQL